MSQPTTPTELADRAGISVPYASQILSGARTPPHEMALKIYGATGLQFGFLKGLTAEQIEPLVQKAA